MSEPMLDPEGKEKVLETVGVIIIKDEQILLVRHTDKADHVTGIYGFPAGRVEDGETKRETAIRELKEEAGLEASESDLEEFEGNRFENIPIEHGGRLRNFNFTVFLAKNFRGEIKPSLNGENIPEWVNRNRTQFYHMLPNTRESIESAIKHLNQ